MAQLALVVLVMLSPLAGSAVKYSGDDDPCKCMSFHKVYKTRAAKCGEAGEPCEWVMNDRQVSFFPFQNHSYCLNKEAASAEQTDKRTWCYVSAQCSNLNGGRTLNGNVSEKICRNTDAKLGDLWPKKLFAMQNWGESILTAQWAYSWEEPANGAEELDAIADPNGPCKLGPSNELDSPQPEATNYLVCGQGIKWLVGSSTVKCKRGCSVFHETIGTSRDGIDAITGKSQRYPRLEAWMYGPAGPGRMDNPDGAPVLGTQTDENSFVLED